MLEINPTSSGVEIILEGKVVCLVDSQALLPYMSEPEIKVKEFLESQMANFLLNDE